MSIGCGLGIVEKHIYLGGYNNVDIHEISDIPLKWIKEIIPKTQIYKGHLDEAGIKRQQYNLIYLGTVDYFFSDDELIEFLNLVKKYLTKGSECLLVSASFEETGIKQRIKMILTNVKRFISHKNKGQLWGFLRTKKDYHRVMKSAGYINISDSFIDEGSYYIKGETL